jgi:hypothetical protein
MPPKENSIVNDLMFSSSSAASGIDIEQVKKEIEFIDRLQSYVEVGNSCVLKSFKIRLRMEYDNDNLLKMEWPET